MFLYINLVEKDQVGFGIDDVKIDVGIFVLFEYQNSPLQLLEN